MILLLEYVDVDGIPECKGPLVALVPILSIKNFAPNSTTEMPVRLSFQGPDLGSNFLI